MTYSFISYLLLIKQAIFKLLVGKEGVLTLGAMYIYVEGIRCTINQPVYPRGLLVFARVTLTCSMNILFELATYAPRALVFWLALRRQASS